MVQPATLFRIMFSKKFLSNDFKVDYPSCLILFIHRMTPDIPQSCEHVLYRTYLTLQGVKTSFTSFKGFERFFTSFASSRFFLLPDITLTVVVYVTGLRYSADIVCASQNKASGKFCKSVYTHLLFSFVRR